MNKAIQQKIIDCLRPFSEAVRVADVRVGLGYTSVRLDNGNLGLAWTAASQSESCTHEAKAGTLAGRQARELLEMLSVFNKPLSRSIGLAAANAVAAGLPRPESTQKVMLSFNEKF